MPESIPALLKTVSGIVWGLPLVFLLVGTGVFLTIRLGGLQFFMLPEALRLVFSKDDEASEGDISHFRALMTALAATIGTGNIAGVASAIAAGGPGAVFWMWITALFGMATKYGEAILAVKYRVVDENGEMAGGPMYALERGLGQKWLGVLFALFGALAAFGIGNMVQANSVAEALNGSFHAPFWITGVVLAILIGLVTLGGIKRIGAVTAYLVPVMAVIYMAAAFVLLVINIREVPHAFELIFVHAFTPTAAAGGFIGAMVKETIQAGVRRGLFSNEAGLGSAPIAAAAAKTRNPKRQALVSMTGTFIDTIIVCTMTGLAIVATGAWSETGPQGNALDGVDMTVAAFHMGYPGEWAGYIVSIGIIFFAYSTILGWGYYGEKCVEYLCGIRLVFPYRVLWVIAVFIGATRKLDTVWDFADIMNALMAVPNLIALIFLSNVIVEESRDSD
ncbi:MAG: amino acid carrier protein [bacterium]|nr:amino acid carrier protein [bacterium]